MGAGACATLSWKWRRRRRRRLRAGACVAERERACGRRGGCSASCWLGSKLAGGHTHAPFLLFVCSPHSRSHPPAPLLYPLFSHRSVFSRASATQLRRRRSQPQRQRRRQRQTRVPWLRGPPRGKEWARPRRRHREPLTRTRRLLRRQTQAQCLQQTCPPPPLPPPLYPTPCPCSPRPPRPSCPPRLPLPHHLPQAPAQAPGLAPPPAPVLALLCCLPPHAASCGCCGTSPRAGQSLLCAALATSYARRTRSTTSRRRSSTWASCRSCGA